MVASRVPHNGRENLIKFTPKGGMNSLGNLLVMTGYIANVARKFGMADHSH